MLVFPLKEQVLITFCEVIMPALLVALMYLKRALDFKEAYVTGYFCFIIARFQSTYFKMLR
jgi:hypothetical protein